MVRYPNHSHAALNYAEKGIKNFVEDEKRIYRKYFLLLNRVIYLQDLSYKEEALQTSYIKPHSF
jgi:hypothetical protein